MGTGFIESKKEREAKDQISALNNELEDKVEERTEELEVALEDLKNTQDRLLKIDSMQSFLLLANRLSHQINTPLGLSLKSNSYVSHVLEDTKNSIENKVITQTEMIKKLSDMNTACDLIENNINESIKVVDSLRDFLYMKRLKKQILGILLIT